MLNSRSYSRSLSSCSAEFENLFEVINSLSTVSAEHNSDLDFVLEYVLKYIFGEVLELFVVEKVRKIILFQNKNNFCFRYGPMQGPMNKMEAIPKRQKISKPWEEKEETALIVEVLERVHTLFGDIKGPGTKSIHRKRIYVWQEITDLLNS